MLKIRNIYQVPTVSGSRQSVLNVNSFDPYKKILIFFGITEAQEVSCLSNLHSWFHGVLGFESRQLQRSWLLIIVCTIHNFQA
jgi:zinc transporter ZupT